MGHEVTLNELKERLAGQFSELELLDALGIDIFELVDILEEQIQDNFDDLIDRLYD